MLSEKECKLLYQVGSKVGSGSYFSGEQDPANLQPRSASLPNHISTYKLYCLLQDRLQRWNDKRISKGLAYQRKIHNRCSSNAYIHNNLSIDETLWITFKIHAWFFSGIKVFKKCLSCFKETVQRFLHWGSTGPSPPQK